ncbi:hypothetical protein [Longitalea arenae]|uniref:hypothetical protein n=1 Tax=Longitalea arenae TaxID=2812558 RepID=UPI0019680568|nr:hypothetical protein [Longitalea arenae]
MKKYIPLLGLSLCFCLFIYVFYRTEKTLVNQLFIALFSHETYSYLKTAVRSFLPLPDFLVYSLPEGLWIFCITVTSSFFYLEIRNRKWSLVLVPILMAVIMEVFQFLHFTNGRFDIIDLVFSFVFWLLALFSTQTNIGKEPVFRSLNSKTVYCMGSYIIVFLAHVSY